jgi:hypothetical protein
MSEDRIYNRQGRPRVVQSAHIDAANAQRSGRIGYYHEGTIERMWLRSYTVRYPGSEVIPVPQLPRTSFREILPHTEQTYAASNGEGYSASSGQSVPVPFQMLLQTPVRERNLLPHTEQTYSASNGEGYAPSYGQSVPASNQQGHPVSYGEMYQAPYPGQHRQAQIPHQAAQIPHQQATTNAAVPALNTNTYEMGPRESSPSPVEDNDLAWEIAQAAANRNSDSQQGED